MAAGLNLAVAGGIGSQPFFATDPKATLRVAKECGDATVLDRCAVLFLLDSGKGALIGVETSRDRSGYPTKGDWHHRAGWHRCSGR